MWRSGAHPGHPAACTRPIRGANAWAVMKAESSYLKTSFLVFFAFIPLLVAIEIYQSYGPTHFWVWFMALMTVGHWNANRIMEKRDYMVAQLPLAPREIGLARAFLVVLTSAAYLLAYAVVRAFFLRPQPLGIPLLVWLFGSVVAPVSVILAWRDWSAHTRAARWGRVFLILVLALLAVLGLYAMLVPQGAGEAGRPMPIIVRFIDYVAAGHPFRHGPLTLSFLAVSLALALLSAVSFEHRKANLD